MIPPPGELDGATVLRVADLGDVAASGRTRHVVYGEPQGTFAALAIARYDSDPACYLFYCDADWRVVTDTCHDTIEGALAQAEFEYPGVRFVDASG
ncbi:MAG TPA: hypothetical protein VF519_05170 [Mycobacteriales bacterium]